MKLPQKRQPLTSALLKAMALCAQVGMWIGGFSVVVMMCLITLGTLSREAFGYAITGTDEIAGALVAVSVYMALAYTFLEDGLIRVEVLRARLAARFRNVLERFLLVVAALYVVVLVTYFWRQAWISAERGVHWVGVLPMPIFPWHALMALGVTLLLLVLVVRMFTSEDKENALSKVEGGSGEIGP